jgi:histidine ammonia-lyase
LEEENPLQSQLKEFKLPKTISLGELADCGEKAKASFPAASRAKVKKCREVLLGRAAENAPIYGVNTGFGSLASQKIPEENLRELQKNLVLSHACGVGDPLSAEEARTLLFLRANELSRGYSGVRPELIDQMLKLFNSGASPLIPCRGSVGASGDLAPQAHMALLLIGEGDAFWNGSLMPSRRVLKKCGLNPFKLEIKEGLSLINGTQAMQAVGGLALSKAYRVFNAAQKAAATSLEALTGTPDPFADKIQGLKAHPGQITVASELRHLLQKSELRESHRKGDPRVQDPYSLRCLPQVHGAVFDVLEFSRKTVEQEMASVTDNPIVFPNGEIVSAGNFHGQALSFAFDFAAAALTSLGNMSERRIFQLILGHAPRLKPFLAMRPGLESGWMIAQVAAAALASENKILSHPASSDSIPTSANQEDFVSMGMGAAIKLRQVVQNTAQIAAIELLCAAHAMEFHKPMKPGQGVSRLLEQIRAKIPLQLNDRILSPHLKETSALILSGYFN